MSIHKALSWAAVVLWMALIFSFSHQPASESSEMSSGITEILVAAAEQVIPGAEEDFDQFEHIVRKNAHLFIYLFLGVLVLQALRKSGVSSYKGMGLAVAICVLYAMSDEFHQLFIPGRSGEVRDVLIDSSGAALGIIVYRLMEKLCRRSARNTYNTQEIQG